MKHFPTRGRPGVVRAVDGVTLDVMRGETLSIVGETGCGKTTLARCIVRLDDVTSGRIVFDGADVTALSRDAMRPFRRRMQLVFQDPYGSLNPRHRVGDIIAEPLVIHRIGTHGERAERVRSLMTTVGLDPSMADRYPHEFSGGQRQRISIARAIALEPDLMVCDEPVSALDVSIRAQILNLLADLQQKLALTYVFISHDLSIVRHVSSRVAVMYLGKIVEIGPSAEVFARPRHPYARALLDAVPPVDPDAAARVLESQLLGDPPSPIDPPSGCRFRTRCPRAIAVCTAKEPALEPKFGDSAHHVAACHAPVDDGGTFA